MPRDYFRLTIVNIHDVNAVRNNFGASTTAVPEPGAAVSAMLAGMVLMLVRRGRPPRA